MAERSSPLYNRLMTSASDPQLRYGWTTGACATAAVRAALDGAFGTGVPDRVALVLPRGEAATFEVSTSSRGDGWCEAGVVKDAGDDPDVTHGVTVLARVCAGASGAGVTFRAGAGVGHVTRPGLPLAVGEPAINPVPREMMAAEVAAFDGPDDVEITISIPGGEEIAMQTWNPRLGIEGGLSILGTTGIVRPFSCAAWIASIHRGIDVARAGGLAHVAGATGATSERVVQAHFGLPDHAMLDMGDFAGGMLKYLARHPVPRLTIGGGFAKMTKLAQGAMDLHSARSQIDFAALAALADDPDAVRGARTGLEAVSLAPELGPRIAERARQVAAARVPDIAVDTIVVARDGRIVGQAG